MDFPEPGGTMRNYWELLNARHEQGSHLCVGLDPNMEKFPPGYADRFMNRGEAMMNFAIGIASATAAFAAAFKPNFWFWFRHGISGQMGLRDLIRYIHLTYPTIPVILDIKVADIGDTNEMAALGLFEEYGADAITVNPYLGRKAMQPFLDRADKGIYVLCRTSNPGAGEFQDLPVLLSNQVLEKFEAQRGCEMSPMEFLNHYKVVAFKVASGWNQNNNCGLVTGATYPGEIEQIRRIASTMPLLIPGVGKQGGDLNAAVKAAMGADGQGQFLINVSSGICHASSGEDFVEAAFAKAKDYRDEIKRIREEVLESFHSSGK